jgi:hypothetical protein
MDFDPNGSGASVYSKPPTPAPTEAAYTKPPYKPEDSKTRRLRQA